MSHESARPLAAQIDREREREMGSEREVVQEGQTKRQKERALSEAWLVERSDLGEYSGHFSSLN